MSDLLSPSEAAKLLGVSVKTLYRWEDAGKISPIRTPGNQRRYPLNQLLWATKPTTTVSNRLTIVYARVSSDDQKQDLKRPIEVLESYAAVHGWSYEVIQDKGSGLNYRKKGLNRLIKLIVTGQVERLILIHKDRLLRFGSDLIFSLCEIFATEIIIINQSESSTYEECLVQDVLEIITVFSARLYGSRSHKNKDLITKLKEATDDL
ncbi:IS607 family transposase [Gloeocapsa sp. PCC 73106]|uniref:IS607 family transposase n=1 Tax=Gloeocapsa sp. PCC 73106 TaxID=102232 RepID=UPI0002ABC36D|nr:IS607 family transposase [Gloeocapsa sp. PCC 73106]ELR99781.1 DNA-binding protein, excisionase family [Gloeocapsa sp. PCC 73106]